MLSLHNWSIRFWLRRFLLSAGEETLLNLRGKVVKKFFFLIFIRIEDFWVLVQGLVQIRQSYRFSKIWFSFLKLARWRFILFFSRNLFLVSFIRGLYWDKISGIKESISRDTKTFSCRLLSISRQYKFIVQLPDLFFIME